MLQLAAMTRVLVLLLLAWPSLSFAQQAIVSMPSAAVHLEAPMTDRSSLALGFIGSVEQPLGADKFNLVAEWFSGEHDLDQP